MTGETALWQVFLLWLPAGTVLPFLISRLTGSDNHLAVVEAVLFAFTALLLYPSLLALLTARFIDWDGGEYPLELLFALGYLLALLTLMTIRRARRRLQRGAASRQWTHFR